VKKAIGAVDPNLTLNNCALRGDAASCALVVRTANGFVNQISGTLQNLDSIKTRGVDVTANYRSPETGIGRFGISANATWLLKYILSASNGFVVIDRKGTERGSPDQAYPKFKGNATIDWSLNDIVNASFTGRYIDAVTEIDTNTGLPHRMGSRFYGDVQLTFTPGFADRRFALTVGVNNVFDTDPPPCVSCSLNNYDPTTYDVPGQFGYVRLSYKM
jgi:iron complex outermembrane receptor protein